MKPDSYKVTFGKTGVGKTALTAAYAASVKEAFGEDAIAIDTTIYADPKASSILSLMGNPAGYIFYEAPKTNGQKPAKTVGLFGIG